jgi:adenylate kinase family enzyme
MTGVSLRHPGNRIVVVGTAGSGKTALARQLGQILDLPHVELDALFWDPGWSAAERGVFRERVATALAGDRWVADGNYSAVRDIVWGRAETVIFLDYRLPVILRRLILRTIRRMRTGEELWNGNAERWSGLFARDSILLWALQTYRRRRREFHDLFARGTFPHLQAVRLRTPGETRDWLRSLQHSQTAGGTDDRQPPTSAPGT